MVMVYMQTKTKNLVNGFWLRRQVMEEEVAMGMLVEEEAEVVRPAGSREGEEVMSGLASMNKKTPRVLMIRRGAYSKTG
jgi:hypothetical protein